MYNREFCNNNDKVTITKGGKLLMFQTTCPQDLTRPFSFSRFSLARRTKTKRSIYILCPTVCSNALVPAFSYLSFIKQISKLANWYINTLAVYVCRDKRAPQLSAAWHFIDPPHWMANMFSYQIEILIDLRMHLEDNETCWLLYRSFILSRDAHQKIQFVYC